MSGLSTPSFSANLLSIAFKHIRTIMAVFLTSMLGSLIAVFLIPKHYESHASILVKPGRENIYLADTANPRDLSRFKPNEAMNTEIQILNSQDLKKAILKQVGVAALYPKFALPPDEAAKPSRSGNTPSEAEVLMDKAVLELGDNLRINGVKDTNVIHLYYVHKDPNLAARVLDKLLELFIQKHVQIHKDPRLPFFEEKSAEYKQKLAEAEASLARFREKYNVFAADDQVRLLLEQGKDLDNSLKGAVNRIGEIQEGLASLDEQLKDIPSNIVTQSVSQDTHIRRAKEELLRLQLQEQQQLAKYKEGSRMVANTRAELGRIKSFLKEHENSPGKTLKTGNNPVYQQLDLERRRLTAELSSIQARKSVNEQQLKQIQDTLSQLSGKKKELHELERKVALFEQNYNAYIAKTEETRTSESLDQNRLTNLRIVDNPTTPSTALGLRRSIQVALASFLGLMLASVYVVFSEFRRGVFLAPEDVQRHLSVSLLAAIPDMRLKGA